MSNLIKNITEFALYLVQGYVSEGDVVVDATCGNGYDTLRLAQLSPAKLYAFDIQQEAVDATRKRLCEAGFAENLDKRQWHCAYINLINQPAAPPEILLITRKKRPE